MAFTSPSTNPVSFDLSSLAAGRRGLSPIVGATMGEAASVCIAEANHPNPAPFKITGCAEFSAHFDWDDPSAQAFASWNDKEFTTEFGAYGIAALLIEEFGFEVVRRARKRTGIDYWIGPREGTSILFQGLGRLEVSGIRSGDDSKVAQRTRIKLEQTKQSDSSGLPAFIVIVEFGSPQAQISKR